MMTSRSLLAIAIGVSAAFAFPVLAQDQDGSVTLRIDQGSAMTSTGGEFASAQSGAALSPGNRVMVPEGGVVTLVYSNNCTRTLDAAGVYTVAQNCIPVAGATTTGAGTAGAGAAGVDWGSAGLLFAGTAAVAGILASQDNVPAPPEYIPPAPPPVSP